MIWGMDSEMAAPKNLSMRELEITVWLIMWVSQMIRNEIITGLLEANTLE